MTMTLNLNDYDIDIQSIEYFGHTSIRFCPKQLWGHHSREMNRF